ncbi:hypothetical protein GLIP_4341 [Aliiglaciecola lipolytica E3]|uniref:Uncharacterized protein n=1 Tax=Aliiglaciecola lipolytica E3 TaxID=1127673 RepID=K6YFM6_9ALTE|nr:hypothetical protein GLIP_4341 [Aliiglaciecola lipolytica E3]
MNQRKSIDLKFNLDRLIKVPPLRHTNHTFGHTLTAIGGNCLEQPTD